jgi:hypothetical protein
MNEGWLSALLEISFLLFFSDFFSSQKERYSKKNTLPVDAPTEMKRSPPPQNWKKQDEK